jgi:hypothetical protein
MVHTRQILAAIQAKLFWNNYLADVSRAPGGMGDREIIGGVLAYGVRVCFLKFSVEVVRHRTWLLCCATVEKDRLEAAPAFPLWPEESRFDLPRERIAPEHATWSCSIG